MNLDSRQHAERLAQIDRLLTNREVLQAELLLRELVALRPPMAEAVERLAGVMLDRGAVEDARALLASSEAVLASAPYHRLQARLKEQDGDIAGSALHLARYLTEHPEDHIHWLWLSVQHERLRQPRQAFICRYKALTSAQSKGRWTNQSTTEPHLLNAVMASTERLRMELQAEVADCEAAIKQSCEPQSVQRALQAIRAWLDPSGSAPPHPRQRPKFFFFPGLPQGPYHDPHLHDWAPLLLDAWRAIELEARRALGEDDEVASFLGFAKGHVDRRYVSGDNSTPSWDALFFYRHGKRFDTRHHRYPATSAVLEAIDRCEITGQAPEICFSVLRRGSTIMPHFGSTNTRLVLHLPLIVPGDCALDVLGYPPHHWKPGELMMFDDTFEHGAWNRSEQDRVILLMDCWNPHLSPEERVAVKRFTEQIGALEHIQAMDLVDSVES